MNNIAIILSGGVGSRMGSEIPKQFFITPFLKKKYLYHLLRLLVCSWNINYDPR